MQRKQTLQKCKEGKNEKIQTKQRMLKFHRKPRMQKMQ